MPTWSGSPREEVSQVVNVDVVAAKLKTLAEHIARVRLHVKATPAELTADQDALDLVSFNLMLAVQVCLDIATHLIADEGWRPAGTLSESFLRLGEHGVLPKELAGTMAQAVGLRNVVAHAYGRLDVALLHRAATQGLAEIERFAQEIAAWTRGAQAR